MHTERTLENHLAQSLRAVQLNALVFSLDYWFCVYGLQLAQFQLRCLPKIKKMGPLKMKPARYFPSKVQPVLGTAVPAHVLGLEG